MGQSIVKVLATEPQMELRGVVDHTIRPSNSDVEAPFGSRTPVFSKWDRIKTDQKVDVVVDFSAPSAFPEMLRWCQKTRTPLVTGTTGLSSTQFRQMKLASKRAPILWSPNMSLGMAFFRKMVPLIAAIEEVGDFDFQIEEIHHRAKRDAPSGTALELQKILEKSTKTATPKPLSIRGGGVFGVHRLMALGDEETIVIEHNALSRDVFARGALKAASWIIGKKTGIFNIDDVISK